MAERVNLYKSLSVHTVEHYRPNSPIGLFSCPDLTSLGATLSGEILSVNVLSGGTASVNLLSGRMLSDSTKSGGLPSVYSHRVHRAG